MQKLNCCCKMTAESACFTALGLGEVVNCSKRTAFHLFVAAAGESRWAEVLQCRLGAGGGCLGPWVQRSSASPVPPHVPTAGSLLLWMVAQGTGERCLRQGCGVFLFYFTVSC